MLRSNLTNSQAMAWTDKEFKAFDLRREISRKLAEDKDFFNGNGPKQRKFFSLHHFSVEEGRRVVEKPPTRQARTYEHGDNNSSISFIDSAYSEGSRDEYAVAGRSSQVTDSSRNPNPILSPMGAATPTGDRFPLMDIQQTQARTFKTPARRLALDFERLSIRKLVDLAISAAALHLPKELREERGVTNWSCENGNLENVLETIRDGLASTDPEEIMTYEKFQEMKAENARLRQRNADLERDAQELREMSSPTLEVSEKSPWYNTIKHRQARLTETRNKLRASRKHARPCGDHQCRLCHRPKMTSLEREAKACQDRQDGWGAKYWA